MKSIIHSIIRFWIRVTSYFFFEKMEVTGIENLPLNGPVIFACNHPNAFLDSIVMTTCAKRPLHYTARGDFFKSKIASALLRYINILPVYRREEGRDLTYKNNETFSYCMALFKKNGALVIFSEGLSENKYELRPLRKGTARIAFEAWSNPDIGDRLKVVPVAIHYSSWLKIFPVVSVEFLENIEKKSFTDIKESGFFNKKFNERLNTILSGKCIKLDNNQDILSQNKVVGFILKNSLNGASFAKRVEDKYLSTTNEAYKLNYKALADFLVSENINYDSKSGKTLMEIALILSSSLCFFVAWLYNSIPFYLCKFIAWKTTKGNDFHDSIFYCILMIIYPAFGITLFCIIISHISLRAGIYNVTLATVSAYFYENSRRILLSFLKRKKLLNVRQMLNRLFETSNG